MPKTTIKQLESELSTLKDCLRNMDNQITELKTKIEMARKILGD